MVLKDVEPINSFVPDQKLRTNYLLKTEPIQLFSISLDPAFDVSILDGQETSSDSLFFHALDIERMIQEKVEDLHQQYLLTGISQDDIVRESAGAKSKLNEVIEGIRTLGRTVGATKTESVKKAASSLHITEGEIEFLVTKSVRNRTPVIDKENHHHLLVFKADNPQEVEILNLNELLKKDPSALKQLLSDYHLWNGYYDFLLSFAYDLAIYQEKDIFPEWTKKVSNDSIQAVKELRGVVDYYKWMASVNYRYGVFLGSVMKFGSNGISISQYGQENYLTFRSVASFLQRADNVEPERRIQAGNMHFFISALDSHDFDSAEPIPEKFAEFFIRPWAFSHQAINYHRENNSSKQSQLLIYQKSIEKAFQLSQFSEQFTSLQQDNPELANKLEQIQEFIRSSFFSQNLEKLYKSIAHSTQLDSFSSTNPFSKELLLKVISRELSNELPFSLEYNSKVGIYRGKDEYPPTVHFSDPTLQNVLCLFVLQELEKNPLYTITQEHVQKIRSELFDDLQKQITFCKKRERDFRKQEKLRTEFFRQYPELQEHYNNLMAKMFRIAHDDEWRFINVDEMAFAFLFNAHYLQLKGRLSKSPLIPHAIGYFTPNLAKDYPDELRKLA